MSEIIHAVIFNIRLQKCPTVLFSLFLGRAVSAEQPACRSLCDHKQREFHGWQSERRNQQRCSYVAEETDSQFYSIVLFVGGGNLKFLITFSAGGLAEVFSWLGFRVLMCKDQTKEQMDRALKCFASLADLSELQKLNVEEWSDSGFTLLQEAPKHGDAFICCVLSHGSKGVVSGVDGKPLSIKEITTAFKATDHSPLTGKPKVFLIQACQGGQIQPGVLSPDLQADDSGSVFIPVEADVLVAFATVEDYKAMRHKIDGSWFIQSVCEQLKEGCPR